MKKNCETQKNRNCQKETPHPQISVGCSLMTLSVYDMYAPSECHNIYAESVDSNVREIVS